MTFQTEKILDVVSKVSMWVTRKSPVQALQCIKFSLKEGVLELSAIDSGTTDISMYIDASGVEGSFNVCIPADRLLPKLQILAKASGELSMTFGNFVTIKSGNHTSKLATVDTILFPTLDRSFMVDSDKVAKKIDGKELVTAIRMTMAAADPKSPFPALEGIFMNGTDVVSADGARLSIYNTEKLVEEETLVPAVSLAKIAKAIDGLEEIYVYRVGGKFIVSWQDGVIATLVINHSFPDYKSLMPTEFETTFSVSRDELAEAISLATTDALDSENLVVISVNDDGKVEISASSSSGKHTSDLDCLQFNGPPKRFGASIKYLKDALIKLKSDIITFSVNAPTALIVLSDSDNYKYGIMPMYFAG